MKTLISPILLVCVMALVSCQKEVMEPANSNYENLISTGPEVESAKTTLFHEDGVDKTQQFIQYNFQFNCNGTVTAEKSGVVINGTWRIYGDSESDPGMVELLFNAAPVSEINGQWQILEQVSTKMRLQTAGSTTNLLTFEKY